MRAHTLLTAYGARRQHANEAAPRNTRRVPLAHARFFGDGRRRPRWPASCPCSPPTSPAHRCSLCLQAVKQGVRVTLAMGEQPTVTTAGGQQVLQAALALPTGGVHARSGWTGGRTGCACAQRKHCCRCCRSAPFACFLPATLCLLRCPRCADPRERAGLYWGYLTRMAPSLAALREQCPFSGGYDLVVGTSGAGGGGGGGATSLAGRLGFWTAAAAAWLPLGHYCRGV